MKTGRYSLGSLLCSAEIEQIVIPELQRDYVWQITNVSGLLNSICDNFNKKVSIELTVYDNNGALIETNIVEMLSQEYMRLRYNTRVGFIYAYHDVSLPGQYYLIDGQQRITTLYLMLLAAYKKYHREDFRKKYFYACNPKLDYMVRQVSHNFLVDFIKFELEDPENRSFKDSKFYYGIYDADTTAQSIYRNYYEVILPRISSLIVNQKQAENFIDYLENYVEFNYFDTNLSEQGEKLYLYMNSRGESLSQQELVRSVVVGRSGDKFGAGEKWEDLQTFFWNRRHENENADKGFNEFLKWATIVSIKYIKAPILKPLSEMQSEHERLEDYIKQNYPGQEYWIKHYIIQNSQFNMEWIDTVKNAIDRILESMSWRDETADREWSMKFPENWLSGNVKAADYPLICGMLLLCIYFPNCSKINMMRLSMYINNLMANIINSKNPDRATLNVMALVSDMHRVGVDNINKYISIPEDSSDAPTMIHPTGKEKNLWIDILRHSNLCDHEDVSDWDRFYWKVVGNRQFNRFLQGNQNFFLRISCSEQGNWSTAAPDKAEYYTQKFIDRIFHRKDSDTMRKELLAYGDVSVYDEGGSWNLGQYMSRYSILADDQDWHTVLNCDDEPDRYLNIIRDYLDDNDHPIQKEDLRLLGEYLEYMSQKKCLYGDGTTDINHIVLLNKKQASKRLSRELPIHILHKLIKGSWCWEHNWCVIDFSVNNNIAVIHETGENQYYIDIWFDKEGNVGKWYCQIGHRKRTLEDSFINHLISTDNPINRGIDENAIKWVIDNGKIKTAEPVLTENTEVDYSFEIAPKNINDWFDKLWRDIALYFSNTGQS